MTYFYFHLYLSLFLPCSYSARRKKPVDGDSATSIGAGDLFSLLPLMARFAGQCPLSSYVTRLSIQPVRRPLFQEEKSFSCILDLFLKTCDSNRRIHSVHT